MRVVVVSSLVSSLLVLAACGGAPKRPGSDPSDTSSLESEGASSSPASASTASSSDPRSGSGPTSAAPAPSAAAQTSGATSATSPAAPAVIHPVPGATGSIDGKPFTPKLAQVTGPIKKDGRLVVTLHEGSDCVSAAQARPGDESITLMVPWQDGYKVDLGSLKRGRKGDPGEAAFTRVGDDGRGHISSTFKPTGRVTIVSAPTDPNALGKMKVDLSSGDYILAGDLDVKVCGPLK